MRLKTLCLAALILAVVCVTPASALEYTMDAPDDYLFARPTSDTTIYEHEDPNVDRSKNTALIPPGFGTPTSYLPGSGTALTPNLVPGALDGGGLVSQVGSVTYPAVDTGSGWTGTTATGWTDVTSDLYYSGGHLGTLQNSRHRFERQGLRGHGQQDLSQGRGPLRGHQPVGWKLLHRRAQPRREQPLREAPHPGTGRHHHLDYQAGHTDL